ncbi:hypothetical protein AM228_04830 [Planktothricoides sp. SR001]|nr:hypothetical protein AM228_04830 [Planktothricoides sp. SR001]
MIACKILKFFRIFYQAINPASASNSTQANSSNFISKGQKCLAMSFVKNKKKLQGNIPVFFIII